MTRTALIRDPRAQAAIRRLTLIWGLAFIAEATARFALSFAFEPAVLMITSPILAASVFGPLGLWTLRQARRPLPTGVLAPLETISRSWTSSMSYLSAAARAE